MRLPAGVTIGRAEQLLTAAFRDAGIDTPALDARLILQARLGLDRAGLLRTADATIPAADTETINQDAARRLRRVSIAHILGAKEFWSLPLAVSADTLSPRPDTEIVVEAALAAIRHLELPRIADLGTGTGAILLALLSELPRAYGVGIDRSSAALAVARGNALRLNFADRCGFVQGDFAAALAAGAFDLIVSNPPYIKSNVIADLAPEGRHEPRLALDGGADGLDAYRALAAQAPGALRRGGYLALEIGADQASAVTAMMTAAGLTVSGDARRDLAGHDRALVFQAN